METKTFVVESVANGVVRRENVAPLDREQARALLASLLVDFLSKGATITSEPCVDGYADFVARFTTAEGEQTVEVACFDAAG